MASDETTQVPLRQGPARARRSWWGFLLRVAVVVAVVLLVLVLLAPMIATSRLGERWASGYVGKLLGRPVVIEGVSLGWVTPLRIERVELPPLHDEGAFPAASLREVRLPLTLTGVLAGGPYDVDLTCEKLEANLVRRRSGAWNWVEVAGRFASNDAATSEPASTDPTVLPVARLKVRFASIDLRVVDASQDLETGLVGSSLGLDWPGGAQPLTLDAAGTLALNQARLPWDVRAKLDHWINDANALTPATAAFTSGSDAMMGAHQITEGGYFVHVGLATTEANEARVVLPLGELSALARASGWAPLADLPAMEGELDWHLTATRHGATPRVEIASALDGREVRLGADNTTMARLPPLDVHHLVEATLNTETSALEVGMTSLQAEGLFVEARASGVPLADPTRAQALTAHVEADFGRLTALASRLMEGDGEAMLSGTLSLQAQALPVDGAPDALALSGTVSARPGVLRTLRPFVASDDLLASGPMDLAPLAFDWAGGGSFDRASGALELTTESYAGDLVPRADVAWRQANGALDSWTLFLDWAVDLGRAHSTFAGPMLPGIEAMSGVVEQRGTLSTALAGNVAGKGLDLYAEDLSLQLAGWPEAFAPGPLRVACQDAAFDQDKGHWRVEGMVIQGAGIDLEGAALWEDRFDVATSATLELATMRERLVPFVALPSELDGVVGVDAATSGTLTGDVRLDVAMATRETLGYVMPGLMTIDQPLAMRARAEATMDAAGAAQRLAVWIEEASLGDLARVDGHLAATPGATMELGGGLTVGYEALLGSLDPALFAASDLGVAASGTTELSVLATGRLDDPAAPWMPRVLETSGRLTTIVEAVEWAAGEMAGGAGGVSDERTFEATLDLADMAASTFAERGRLAIEAIDGPEPIAVSGIELETETTSQGFSTWRLALPRVAVAEARYAVPMVASVALADVASSATLDLDLAAQRLAVADLGVVLGEVADLRVASTRLAWGTGEWNVDAAVSVPELRDLATFYTLDPVMAETLPSYGGRLEASINGGGTLDMAALFDKGHMPFVGEAKLALDNALLNMRDGVRMNGVDLEVAMSSPGDDLLLVTGKGAIGALSNAALAPKPVREATFEFEAGMYALDQVQWRLVDFDSGNWRTRATASGSASGLRPALAGPVAPGLHYWLDQVRFDAEARIEQDFAGFNNYLDPLVASGVADVTLRWSSAPQTALTTNALLDLRDINLAWGEVFSLEGLAGTTELRKTLVHGALGRVPPPLPAGELRLDRLAFGMPPYVAEMRDTRMAIKGLEPGLSVRTTTTQLLAGTAATSWDIALREGDPTITGRVESTGLDLAALAAELTTSQTRRSWEMNGVADLQWRLRDVQGARFMEDLSLAIRSTRIGDRAFRRLLDGLDPRGDNPQLIAARRALVLGSPEATSFTLEGGLVSFDARLKSAAGLVLPLPILDRQPYSGLFAVYGLDETVGLMGLARWGLVLMLAPDVATIEAATGMNG